LASPSIEGGESGEENEFIQEAKKFLVNGPSVFLTGSDVDQVVKVFGKPNFEGSRVLVYIVEGGEGEDFSGIVNFHFDSSRKITYGESIRSDGKIVFSTFQKWTEKRK